MINTRRTPDWRPLALGLAVLMAAYAVVYRLVPFDTRAYLLWPFAALALFGGARLSTLVAVPLTFGVIAVTDLVLYRASAVPPNYSLYVSLGASLLIGRALLGRSQSPWRVVVGSVGSYVLFFLVSNFAAWLEGARGYYEPHTIGTLLQAYAEGLAFLRMQPGQLDCGLILSLGLFGAHALLAKAYFPAERVAAEGVR